MDVLVLADTHAPSRWRGVPEALTPALQTADVILHAGDVCRPDVLDELADYAPVHVVQGNNDGEPVRAWGAVDVLEVELGGVAIGMLHDAGPTAGRGRRMRKQFPAADLVVFGHSHIPMDVVEEGLHLFNPGSPTDRRRQPNGTYGLLQIKHGQLIRSQLIALPR